MGRLSWRNDESVFFTRSCTGVFITWPSVSSLLDPQLESCSQSHSDSVTVSQSVSQSVCLCHQIHCFVCNCTRVWPDTTRAERRTGCNNNTCKLLRFLFFSCFTDVYSTFFYKIAKLENRTVTLQMYVLHFECLICLYQLTFTVPP
jgi:hypothetical protein